MKKILSMLFAIIVLTTPVLAVEPVPENAITIEAPSAILMERSSGAILYEKNAKEHLSPASVTKIMTMLLVAEEIAAGHLVPEEMVTASARAASMGGSQIWLEEGEQMSVNDMLKCVAVVSANDCCVALAEHIAGTEEAFVQRMNERAKELGMNDSHFTCCSGLLETDDHYSCAYDIALMSRELMQHKFIKDYTTVWMDSIRDGAFTLSNTNKLIFHYQGATGLKTGFTSKAMYCLSASAEREGVEYIAVVLHAETSTKRFESAKTLLNYAFANYTLATPSGLDALAPLSVELGEYNSVQPLPQGNASFLIEKNRSGNLAYEYVLPESIKAPVAEGQELGYLKITLDHDLISELPLVASCSVARLNPWQIFCQLLKCLAGGE